MEEESECIPFLFTSIIIPVTTTDFLFFRNVSVCHDILYMVERKNERENAKV